MVHNLALFGSGILNFAPRVVTLRLLLTSRQMEGCSAPVVIPHRGVRADGARLHRFTQLHSRLQRTVEEGGKSQGRPRHSRAARGWAAAVSGRPWVRRAAQVVEFLRGRGRVHRVHGRLPLAAPGYSPRDVNDWFDGQSVSAEALVPQTSRLEARTRAMSWLPSATRSGRAGIRWMVVRPGLLSSVSR